MLPHLCSQCQVTQRQEPDTAPPRAEAATNVFDAQYPALHFSEHAKQSMHNSSNSQEVRSSQRGRQRCKAKVPGTYVTEATCLSQVSMSDMTSDMRSERHELCPAVKKAHARHVPPP